MPPEVARTRGWFEARPHRQNQGDCGSLHGRGPHSCYRPSSWDYGGSPSGFRRRCFRRDGRTAVRHHLRMGDVQERIQKIRRGSHLVPMGAVDYSQSGPTMRLPTNCQRSPQCGERREVRVAHARSTHPSGYLGRNMPIICQNKQVHEICVNVSLVCVPTYTWGERRRGP